MAEIYIGRVFEDHRATTNTATLMAQVCTHTFLCGVTDRLGNPSRQGQMEGRHNCHAVGLQVGKPRHGNRDRRSAQ
jgi:hypothetical protein